MWRGEGFRDQEGFKEEDNFGNNGNFIPLPSFFFFFVDQQEDIP